MELPGRARRILYLFDPAGEHYTGATEVRSLRYLDHSEALLFIVDPLALPQLRRTLTGDERAFVDEAAASSEEDPADTLQRVLNELRSRPDQGRQKRVAVIVTKTDLLTRTEIGRGLDDTDLREWLGRVGLGNTVRALDQVAAQVRYFASGLGTEPAGRRRPARLGDRAARGRGVQRRPAAHRRPAGTSRDGAAARPLAGARPRPGPRARRLPGRAVGRPGGGVGPHHRHGDGRGRRRGGAVPVLDAHRVVSQN
ncbi:TRAFAC clade GTPase domain-containing protein [Actinomadura madurae]|uniref:TRAFAC clade GTPase domain-containing protein n=1 Tax=Actinomadura madurae TaxID=1993 RepID=UPI0020D24381|nr:hypothetical protein [Actinomadura madurae]